MGLEFLKLPQMSQAKIGKLDFFPMNQKIESVSIFFPKIGSRYVNSCVVFDVYAMFWPFFSAAFKEIVTYLTLPCVLDFYSILPSLSYDFLAISSQFAHFNSIILSCLNSQVN